MHSDRMRKTKGYMPDMPMAAEAKPMLPTFNLSEKDLPEVKDWKVGKTYHLEMEVEQIETRKEEYAEGEPIVARFRIVKIKSESDNSEHGKKGYA